MPADAMIVSAAIVSMFLIFAAVLYWGEKQTGSLQQDVSGQKARRRSF